jgi:hypothetical protein
MVRQTEQKSANPCKNALLITELPSKVPISSTNIAWLYYFNAYEIGLCLEPAISKNNILTLFPDKRKKAVLWKEAQQEVRQHWFIDSYIAACIQVQYRVIGVHPTGLTVTRGVSRCPQFLYKI